MTSVVCALVGTGCGGSAKHPASPPVTRPRSTTPQSVATSTAATTPTARTTTTAVVTSASDHQRDDSHAAARAAERPSRAPALLVTHIAGLGAAEQVIAVATDGYGASTATVTAYERGATGWKQVFGPWFAYIGRNGVAPVGAKREGDGRTPSGVYDFDFIFGVNADPGVHFPFRRITGANIVWDDDSTSTNYNRWIDTNTASAGVSPEPMYTAPSDSYGVVIVYNDEHTSGLGSAMFLHVSHGSSTAGCVSLPRDDLLALLRWLDPARSSRIAIGTLAHLSA